MLLFDDDEEKGEGVKQERDGCSLADEKPDARILGEMMMRCSCWREEARGSANDNGEDGNDGGDFVGVT